MKKMQAGFELLRFSAAALADSLMAPVHDNEFEKKFVKMFVDIARRSRTVLPTNAAPFPGALRRALKDGFWSGPEAGKESIRASAVVRR